MRILCWTLRSRSARCLMWLYCGGGYGGATAQGSSGGVETFSVRGDGLTTVTVVESAASAVVAHAAHATYDGSVLVAQAARAGSDVFWLFKVGFSLLLLLRGCKAKCLRWFGREHAVTGNDGRRVGR